MLCYIIYIEREMYYVYTRAWDVVALLEQARAAGREAQPRGRAAFGERRVQLPGSILVVVLLLYLVVVVVVCLLS